MSVLHKFRRIAIGVIICASTTQVHAANALGFYIGGAAGKSHIRDNTSASGGISASTNGWMVRAGIKPIPLIGVEAEYADFGKVSTRTAGIPAEDYSVTARSSAVFAVLYVPNPVPKLDLIIKAGYSNLKRTISGTWTFYQPGAGACAVGVSNCAFAPITGTVSQTSSDIAYGAGVQFKLLKLMFRAEYERIHDTLGDPDMATLGVAVKF